MEAAKIPTLTDLKNNSLPNHIAVILDGNGRWAKSRGLKRLAGHRHGAEAVDKLLDTLLSLKIPVVSLYVFSTENWRRPKSEITGLFKLLDEFILKKRDKMIANGIRLHISGDLSKLPASSRKKIVQTQADTSKGKNLVANFCLNYGSQDELARALTSWHREMADLPEAELRAKLQKKVNYKIIEKHLDTSGLPDVDLLIRTAGEKRLSNYLLLQAAYAELYFTDTLWPDFTEEDLFAAIGDFQNRVRKFGGLK